MFQRRKEHILKGATIKGKKYLSPMRIDNNVEGHYTKKKMSVSRPRALSGLHYLSYECTDAYCYANPVIKISRDFFSNLKR